MISVIVIGKNEGERLVACLKSIQTALSALAHEVVYVDSCSTDQSLQTAKALGARCFLLAERCATAAVRFPPSFPRVGWAKGRRWPAR